MILKVTLKVYSLGTLTLDRRFEQRPGGLREALTINIVQEDGYITASTRVHSRRYTTLHSISGDIHTNSVGCH